MSNLGYVPPPLPDETVYSVLAATVRLMPDNSIMRTLLDGAGICARPIWPVGLRRIAAALPKTLGLCPERLFLEHTLAPLHLPFLEENRRREFLEATMEVRAGEPAKSTGASHSGISQPLKLRCCRSCIADDTARYGRPSFKRVHQVPGVLFCPIHGEALSETNVARSGAEHRRRHIDLRDATISTSHIPALDSRENQIGHEVAHSLGLLMAGVCVESGPEAIRIWLRDRLRAQGFAYRANKVDLLGVRSEFDTWSSAGLRNALGFTGDGNSWLVELLRSRAPAIHPLHFVLLCRFLGHEVDTALKAAAEHVPATHSAPRPMRRGISPREQRLSAAKTTLRRLWPARRISVAEIARRLGTDPLTIKYWASTIGLPFPRPGKRTVVAPPKRAHLQPFHLVRRCRRSEWLIAIRQVAAPRDNMAWLPCGRAGVGQ